MAPPTPRQRLTRLPLQVKQAIPQAKEAEKKITSAPAQAKKADASVKQAVPQAKEAEKKLTSAPAAAKQADAKVKQAIPQAKEAEKKLTSSGAGVRPFCQPYQLVALRKWRCAAGQSS